MNTLKNILLVEDNPNDVELVREAFYENNLINDLVVVGDGEQALDYLYRRGKFADRNQNDPAIILLNLKMLKMDGLEVLAAVKRDPGLHAIPIVMMTSSREESDLIRSHELGVNGYVVKPIDFEQFLTAARQLGIFWAIFNERPKAQSHPAGGNR